MQTLRREDGIELHWQERGSGPLVVIAPYWSMHPSSFEPLIGELDGYHRVVTYHDRGTGSSTRRGPYDLDTSAADLEAVVETAGEAAVIVATADGCNRAVRVAAARPDLVRAVVTIGGAPVARPAMAERLTGAPPTVTTARTRSRRLAATRTARLLPSAVAMTIVSGPATPSVTASRSAADASRSYGPVRVDEPVPRSW